MRILVTGNTGQIGVALVPFLLEAGYQLRTFDRTAQGRGQTWEHIPGDLRDAVGVRRAVQGADAVVHLAAISHDRLGGPDEIHQVNVLGTLNVLQACAEAGVERVVFFSSVNSLGNFQGHRVTQYFPIDDAYPRHPMSPYQLSKHLGEEACCSYTDRCGMVTICLRPVAVVSPESYAHFHRPAASFWGRMVKADYWSYVDVRDVCQAALLSLKVRDVRHDAFLLAAEDTRAAEPTAQLIDEHYPNVPWPKVDRETYLAANPYRSLVDCSHAADLLGWRPRYSWRQISPNP